MLAHYINCTTKISLILTFFLLFFSLFIRQFFWNRSTSENRSIYVNVLIRSLTWIWYDKFLFHEYFIACEHVCFSDSILRDIIYYRYSVKCIVWLYLMNYVILTSSRSIIVYRDLLLNAYPCFWLHNCFSWDKVEHLLLLLFNFQVLLFYLILNPLIFCHFAKISFLNDWRRLLLYLRRPHAWVIRA
jgi:hypothetical protein